MRIPLPSLPFLVVALFPAFAMPAASLKLITQNGYLPGKAALVRVEVLNQAGQRDRDLWNAEATLAANAGVTLSTNRVSLQNGLGTALVVFSGGGDFTLTATVGGMATNRLLRTLAALPVTTVTGTLPGSSTTWSNVINVTGDVTVPAGHTLTIRSNTLVLINGVASGTVAPDLIVNGTLLSQGTEDHPVTITCNDPAQNWGQIRHVNAQPSTYRYTFIHRAGRATGEGHTGSGPAIRPSNSTIIFENSTITDLNAGTNMIGKTMMSDTSDLTFRDCVLARSRMGPEIASTALSCTNTWITDMRGPDDADGVYLHSAGGRALTLTGCVLAGGDDDAVDTLDSDVTVENCIIRDWPNPNEDAKGISAFHGEVRVVRCLIVDCFVGVAGKSGGPQCVVRIDRSTITGITRALSAAFKANATVGNIDFRVTNCVVRSADAIHTDFGTTNFTIGFCDLSEAWPGAGNLTADPLFVNEPSKDFHLLPASPCINAGDPASGMDGDGSRVEMGVFPFTGSGPFLSVWITNPTEGTALTAPVDLVIDATATDSDGTVTRVEFRANGGSLGQDTNAPFSFTWTNTTAGIYALTAIATDNSNTRATSAPVNITINNPSTTTTNTLIGLGSTWKYLDDGSDQGTDWIAPAFDDAGWASGPGQLGYGDGDEATVVNFGPNAGNKYVTTYFRRSFVVENAALVQTLTVNILRDDGAVVYINGQEAFGLSMPSPHNYLTYATEASEYFFNAVDVSPGMLVTGTNVIAVEVHQGSAGSSDMSFELELSAVIAPPSNFAPLVTITSPPNNTTFAAPANVSLAANASDPDGTVTNVAFYQNGVKLADDAVAPYAFAWNPVPAGVYALTAVATDGQGLSATSTVVNLTVSTNTAAPTVVSKTPPPGIVTNLTSITVNFSKPVIGVDAADFLVRGVPATSVSGSGSNYTFSFPQPTYGTVNISWVSGHGITDLFTPPAAFNRTGPGATWLYQFNDVVPPLVTTITPVPGSTVAGLTNISITFNEAVTGVNAGDLLINSGPATSVSGSGAGPYVFGSTQPPAGVVQLTWAGGHGIQDTAANPFAGGLWSYTLDPNATGVVISEIMYHPSSENVLEEYIELFNKGAAAVNLTDWRFSGGVQFTFPDVTISGGAYLVVAADVPTFTAKHPGISNVVGGWAGILNNSHEDIDLDDALGNRVDSVEYADEGDWGVRQRGPLDGTHRGWVWLAEHDGLGKSLELLNPNLSNNSGQNWRASQPTNGTPGVANSVLTNNIAPMVLEANHSPIVPRSTDPVVISARLVDETANSFTVTLNHRISAVPPPSFVPVTMNDHGTNGDAVAGDGLYGARLLPIPNNSVVEYYISAIDQQGASRTWPAAAIPAFDQVGPPTNAANALFQVDDAVYAGSQPLYKLIMTEAERAELAQIPGQSSLSGPNSQMNATFISADGAGQSLRYLVGVRNRGHGSRTAFPPNYRVNFRTDDIWKDVTGINLNTRQVHVQHLGSVVARKAGVAGGNTAAVQVRVNNVNLAVSGAPMFGSYAANEVVNGDWADNHFPFDGNGNVYRAVRDIPPPDFSYRGEDKNAYINTWFKQSNVSEDDWSDLIGMLRVVGINNSTPFTSENVRQVVNVEQWLRHLAVMNLFGNSESGLNSGFNDDYSMYRGINDPRFILMYYDLDQILGQGGSFGETAGLFTATQNNGSGQAMDRFLHHPDFEPIYYRILRELLETTLSQTQFDALVDQTLGGYVTGGTISAIKTWMNGRRTFVLSQLPPDTTTNAPVARVSGVPRSPTPRTTATLTVGGAGVTHYQFRLNAGGYGPETPVTTAISLSGLANGTNTISVIGRNADGLWQEVTNATVVAWVVNTSWPAVRLNEVLARNDSAVNHSNTFPDMIELFNEGSSPVDISGMRLTDDPANPNKFAFPGSTTLPAGGYLTVFANDPDGTPGFHVGFSLNQNGEGVYLFHRLSAGAALLDSVEFGLQLPNLSIARVNGGDWSLSIPAFNAANAVLPLADSRSLRINEWLTASFVAQDFLELFNPDSLPAALGGLYLTDEPIGAPSRHQIAPLSFIAGYGYTVFTADGDVGQGAEHLNFRLALEMGELALMTPDLAEIDCVTYGPQLPDVARGRCPDGALRQVPLILPTPGGPNACPFEPPPPVTVNLITISNTWRYDDSGVDLGTNWITPTYDDSGWPTGPALLGFDTATLPEPFRTPLTLASGKMTFYFRTQFNVVSNLTPAALQITHIVDDGIIVYLNGVEVNRYNMPPGPVNFNTAASSNIGDAGYFGPVSIPLTNLQTGQNVLAVELHQSTPQSGDLAFGLRMDAVIAIPPGAAGVLINEVLANNATLEETDGSKPDWVEIFNPSTNAVDLADMSLTDNAATPRRWVFPSGSLLPAVGFLRVRFDGDAPMSSTNTGFGLKANGGAVFLFNRIADGGTVASAVSYGLQAADFSIGRVPNGSATWVLTVPSPATANIAASLGDPAQLRINEWMADATSGADWFELYNPNAQPVDISRLWLTDDLNSRLQHQLPLLSFIGVGPYGFQRFDADEMPSGGADHVNFKLDATEGEAIGISALNGTLINGISFGPQLTGVSQGRLPDGTANIVSFPTTPTPGNGNFLPLANVVVNELLSHSDPPLEDAVEFYNPSGDDVDISGWYLSDSQNNLQKYRIPANTRVLAGGYLVLYEYQFNTDHPGELFSFSSARGDEVYLSQASAPGVLTGYRAFATFDASENGVSFGRFPTSVGADFTAMSAHTFGVDNPASTNDFRTGTGRTNAYPKVGPVVINEIMYHPSSTNDALEYVELHNILGTSVPLFDPANPNNTWRLRKGVDFNFPPNTTIAAGGYLVIVSFNPQLDAASLAAFQAAYGTGMTLLGPYSGRLDNAGETVELQKPDAPQTLPGPDFGLVPRVVVDRISYLDVAPWPVSADGLGDSLKRVTASLYGNEPLNWSAGAPTPGASNGGGGPVNTAPVLGSIGNKAVVEGSLLSFTATANDTDTPPQTLTFSLDSGAPVGASINPSSGVFNWTPSEAQGPGVYPVTIRVTDSGSPVLSDAETISITVSETNAAPVLDPIGNKAVAEGALVTFTATADDADIPTQTLTYTIDAGAPAGAVINATNGIFNWTPSEAQGPGTYPVTVRVTDNGTPARNDSETINIVVSEANTAPVLALISNQTNSPGNLITFTASATDADLPAQSLAFSLDPGAPAGAGINPTSGVFTWTPTQAQASSTNVITVRVTDNGSPLLADSQAVTVYVLGRPRITTFTVSPSGVVTLTWSSTPGKTYRVQHKANLATGSWNNLGGLINATSTTTTTTDNVGANIRRFYQILQTN
jgi:hypothetical protein